MAFFGRANVNSGEIVDDRKLKLQEEIRSLELRKESVFNTINSEINRLENERRHIFLQAGEASYKIWSKEASEPVSLEEYWNQVKEIENKIAEQEAKKQEMGARYDEEISLIGNNLTSSQAETETARKCPKCGTAVGESDMFCEKCGEKLEQVFTPVAAGRKCPNCGADCDADAVFCMSCGTKLG